MKPPSAKSQSRILAVVITVAIGACLYFPISRHVKLGDSTPLMYLVALGLPLSVYWAIVKTRRMFAVRSTNGKDACDKLRARTRLLGECASTIAIIGTIFSLTSAFRAFDAADSTAHYRGWSEVLPVMKEATTSVACANNKYLRSTVCPGIMEDMKNLGTIYLGFDVPGWSVPSLISDIRLKTQILEPRLTSSVGDRLQNAVDILRWAEPNDSAFHFAAVFVYEIVWFAAVVGAACKLSVAAFDARVRFRFGQRKRKLFRDSRRRLAAIRARYIKVVA